MRSSLLNHYKKLLMIRRANPEIARGEYTALKFTGTKLGGFVSAWEGKRVMVLHNTTNAPLTVDLQEVNEAGFTRIVAVAGAGEAALEGTSAGKGSAVLFPFRPKPRLWSCHRGCIGCFRIEEVALSDSPSAPVRVSLRMGWLHALQAVRRGMSLSQI